MSQYSHTFTNRLFIIILPFPLVLYEVKLFLYMLWWHLGEEEVQLLHVLELSTRWG
jgi:hypothetical protein